MPTTPMRKAGLIVAGVLLMGAAVKFTTDQTNYRLPSTGATPYLLTLRLLDEVWVTDFGVRGDGTDETSKIQTAINNSYGKTLNFPFGMYTITTLNISSTAGITLRGHGATLASNQKIAVQFTGASSNVVFDGLKFTTSDVSTSGVYGLITGVAAWPLANIKVVNCDFTGPTSSTNGIKFDLSNVASSLVGLEVSGSRFVGVGQMGVEIVNHTFDNVSRYEQVRIVNNRFDGLAVSSGSAFGMAVSLSGMGENNVLANNTISQAKDIAIELVGAWNTAVTGNTMRNLQANVVAVSAGKPASASAKPQGISIVGNIIEGNGGIAFQPTGTQYLTISGNVVTGTGKVSIESDDFITLEGNTFDVTNTVLIIGCTYVTATGNRFASRTNTVGFNPTITNTTLSTFSGTTFQSERGTGLLVNGTSSSNTFSGCIFSNENSAAAGPTLQFDGASATNNLVSASQFRRTAAGGTTWAQSTGATGNFIVAGLPNTVNPDSVSVPAPLSFTTGPNSWVTPLKVNGTFIYMDSVNTLRFKTTAPTADKDGTPTGQPPTSLFANLGTPANGTLFFCSDCTIANPCAGAGTGALAKRLNGAWVCN